MIDVRKVGQRGMVITICNFAQYQNHRNYSAFRKMDTGIDTSVDTHDPSHTAGTSEESMTDGGSARHLNVEEPGHPQDTHETPTRHKDTDETDGIYDTDGVDTEGEREPRRVEQSSDLSTGDRSSFEDDQLARALLAAFRDVYRTRHTVEPSLPRHPLSHAKRAAMWLRRNHPGDSGEEIVAKFSARLRDAPTLPKWRFIGEEISQLMVEPSERKERATTRRRLPMVPRDPVLARAQTTED